MLQVWALDGIPEITPGDDLVTVIADAAAGDLADGDIVVVTSKIVSKAEGRIVAADDREDAITAETVRVVASRSTPNGATDSILAFDYDLETAATTNRRRFAELHWKGSPDGASVDTDGAYWTTLFRGGRIVKFGPDGEVERLIESPVENPTMLSFGDDDLGSLYLTTAWRYLSDEARAQQPLAGGVFRARLGATGLPEPRFGVGLG